MPADKHILTILPKPPWLHSEQLRTKQVTGEPVPQEKISCER